MAKFLCSWWAHSSLNIRPWHDEYGPEGLWVSATAGVADTESVASAFLDIESISALHAMLDDYLSTRQWPQGLATIGTQGFREDPLAMDNEDLS